MAHFFSARFTSRAPVGHFFAQTVQYTQLSLVKTSRPREPGNILRGSNG